GLVKEVRIGDSTKVQFDANTKHHYHFYDETSGKLMDIDPAQVEVKTHLPKGVKLSEVEVVIKGKWK
ncbi:MAG: hypothetical protein KDD46_07830, partial [Bdellovibrionales bacterium]|nr:hypothetical protein [Bdellovibrionales bacterium]